MSLYVGFKFIFMVEFPSMTRKLALEEFLLEVINQLLKQTVDF